MSDEEQTKPVPLLSMSAIEERIGNLPLSADAKSILLDIARLSVNVGTAIVRAGQRILSFILDLVKEFPNTSFGIVAAYVVSALVASIPVFGVALGPLLSPLLFALGISAGALADFKERTVTNRVRQFERELAGLTSRQ